MGENTRLELQLLVVWAVLATQLSCLFYISIQKITLRIVAALIFSRDLAFLREIQETQASFSLLKSSECQFFKSRYAPASLAAAYSTAYASVGAQKPREVHTRNLIDCFFRYNYKADWLFRFNYLYDMVLYTFRLKQMMTPVPNIALQTFCRTKLSCVNIRKRCSQRCGIRRRLSTIRDEHDSHAEMA